VSAVAAGSAVQRSLPEKVGLGVEIARTYMTVRRRLRKTGLQPTLASLRAPLAGAGSPAPGPAVLDLGRPVRRTLRLVPADSRCLTQSLVLIGLLARRGVPTTLVIGIEGTGERFGAHAWVEHEHRPLLPPGTDPDRRLAEL
jgi:Transglutaminase-like superfamily